MPDDFDITKFVTGLGTGMLSTVGGIVGAKMKETTDRTLIKEANEESLRRWNMENEYNSPIEWKKRMEAAGLNPALALGSGATALGKAGGAPAAQASQGQNPLERLADFYQIRNMDAQYELLKAQADSTKSSAAEANARTTAIAYENEANSKLAQNFINIGGFKVTRKEAIEFLNNIGGFLGDMGKAYLFGKVLTGKTGSLIKPKAGLKTFDKHQAGKILKGGSGSW